MKKRKRQSRNGSGRKHQDSNIDAQSRSMSAPTLADALSDNKKERLARLRKTLDEKHKETITSPLSSPNPLKQNRPLESQSRHLVPKDRIGVSASIKASQSKTRSKVQQVYRLVAKSVGEHTEPSNTSKFRKRESQFQYWELPAEAQVREVPPEDVSEESCFIFDRYIHKAVSEPRDCKGKLLRINIGLDLGTSSTKIIARLPFEADQPTVAIPAPVHCRSIDHPYLWQTVLWIRSDGKFLCYPDRGAHLLHALKQGMMGNNPDAVISPETNDGLGVTRIEAVVAYLAYVIRYVRGWLMSERPELLRGRRLSWSVNVGLPAAGYDNRVLVGAYRRAAAAALMLAD